MAYKLICIDIDGTLINSKYQIGERTKQAIRAAMRRGYIVTLVTGRRYLSTVGYARELGLDLPLICFNGGLIADSKTGRPFYATSIPRDYAARVFSAWSSLSVPVFAFRHSMSPPDVYHQNSSDHHRIQAYLREEGQNVATVDNLLDAVQWDPMRIMTYGYTEPTERCYHQFQELYSQDKIQTYLTAHYDTCYLEVLPHQATKANGLRWLSKHYNISRRQIIAIGDNLNDLDMLEWAGLGVAMGNAVPEAKAVADVVTGHCDEDGVAQFLEQILAG